VTELLFLVAVSGCNVTKNIRQMATLSCPLSAFVSRISLYCCGQLASGDDRVTDVSVIGALLDEMAALMPRCFLTFCPR